MGSVRKKKLSNLEMCQKYARRKRRNKPNELSITKEPVVPENGPAVPENAPAVPENGPAVPENDPTEAAWVSSTAEETFGSEQEGNLVQDIKDLMSQTFRRETF